MPNVLNNNFQRSADCFQKSAGRFPCAGHLQRGASRGSNKASQLLLMLVVIATTVAAALFFEPQMTQAAVCNQDTSLNVIVKDPSGAYISNATVELYKQETDISGLSKATTRVASAKTDAVLGKAGLKFRNSAVPTAIYALKIKTVNSDAAAFWFYNLSLRCGESTGLEKTLSGVVFVLRNSTGSYLGKTKFDVYSQKYDANYNPLEEKKEKLISLTTDADGRAKVYLPAGSVRGNGSVGDYYVLEMTRNNQKFNYFNIRVNDGQLTTVNYYVSSLRVKLEYASGLNFPPGTKVEVFRQESTSAVYQEAGAKVTEFIIGDGGYGTIEVPGGTYVLGIKKSDNSYQYFWSVIAREGQRAEHTVVAEGISAAVACGASSKFILTLRDVAGNFLSGLKFELYEQEIDANGLPIAGKKVGSGTVNNSGQATLTLKPATGRAYALKVWNKRADLGEFWFFDAVRFVCDYDRYLTEYLPALTIALRGADGQLQRNYNFSLYLQRYDFDGNPFFESKDLIANLKTDGGGRAVVYVAPFNTYVSNQTGAYAISVKNEKNKTEVAYNIQVPADSDYTFQYTFKDASNVSASGTANTQIPANPANPTNTADGSNTNSADASGSNISPAANVGNAGSAVLSERLKGRILLQVESKGQAWYVNPTDGQKYYLGRPTDAFSVMRRFGLGINNKDFAALLLDPENWRHLAGRILLKTEDNGRAYYFDPVNLRVYYLGRPSDAFEVMRNRGLGITNSNLNQIGAGD